VLQCIDSDHAFEVNQGRSQCVSSPGSAMDSLLA
jgi:hypothetical protein